MGATTPRGYRFPLDGDQFDPPLDLGNLASDIDADVERLAAGSAAFLASSPKTNPFSGSVNTTTMTTIHSVTVNIPEGLQAGKRIEVTGFVHCVTASGIGARIGFQGGTAWSTGGSQNGQLHAFPLHDANTAAGNRTYNLQVAKTVSAGDALDWRYPYIRVVIV